MNYFCHCGRSEAETRNPLKKIVIPRLTRDPLKRP